MRTWIGWPVLVAGVFAAACGNGPAAPLPVALGGFELVRVDGAALPVPLPAWLHPATDECGPDEEPEHRLTSGRLELAEWGSFSLVLDTEEVCLSGGTQVRTQALSALVQGHHSATGDSVFLAVPVGGPGAIELEHVLAGRAGSGALELAGRGRAAGATWVFERRAP